MQTITIGDPDDPYEFEGKKLDEKILGTGPDDTKKIAFYETLDGRYLKHVVHGVNKDEEEWTHEVSEVSSFEVP